ncbi:DUF5719 family protein [Microbacterium sp. YY-01]|uniref:DUF5719 family protein n=1 Tax=Microbacterium sp. YY-01 TaxID=3421634 RepID=UPI003D1795AC
MRKRTGTTIVATSIRAVVGVVIVGALGVGGVAAAQSPWPRLQSVPTPITVESAAADMVVACAGPLVAMGRDAANPTELTVAAQAQMTVGAEGSVDESGLITSAHLADSSWPLYRVDRSDTDAMLGAAQSATISADDLKGFAASACRTPQLESWIVGGATDLGTSDVLMITNPAEVSASVSLSMYGVNGRSTLPRIAVPARTQISVPLAAGVAGESSPVVRITATGAPVQASLQSSLIRTLDPSGIDVQDATGAPRTQQSLLGVRVMSEPIDNAPNVIVRVLVPDREASDGAEETDPAIVEGDVPTVPLTIVVRDAVTNDPVGVALDVAVTPGMPAEIGIPSLGAGYYSIDVSSAQPAVAAVWQATTQARGMDFAWMTAAPVIENPTVVAVPAGPAPQLHIRAATAKETVVTLTPLDGGQPIEATIEGNGSALIPVTDRTSYVLESSEPVMAAVTMSATSALAGWPIWPQQERAEPVRVYS